MNPFQAVMDRMSEAWQKKRAESQMTLGKMIQELAAMPVGCVVANLRFPHSYRGFYEDLAFERKDGTRPAAELLRDCQEAVTSTYRGYKGGYFRMHADTPVWVANEGDCGHRLMALHGGGAIGLADAVPW